MAQHAKARCTPSCPEPTAPRIGESDLPAGTLPAVGSVVALAVLAGHSRGRRSAELSVVTVFDGEIGDPVTWADESGTQCGTHCPRGAAIFAGVADDIHAHLGSGPVVVHNAPQSLALLGRFLPHWRPAVVFDMRLLSRQFADTTARRPAFVGPQFEHSLAPSLRRSGSADRALATAHQFVRMTSA